MIRDLTKSALSLSWACTLLGAKQAINLVQPGAQGRTNMFAPLAQAAADQLDNSMKGIYRSGDSLQSAIVDITWSSLNPINWLNPGAWGNIWRAVANRPATENWTSPFTNTVQSNDCCGQSSGMDQRVSMESSSANMPRTQEMNSGTGWGSPMSGAL
jgi:hypothetical protein